MSRGWTITLVATSLSCLASGCLGGDFDYEVGFPCQDTLECRSGLSCQYGRCRQPCSFDLDCSGACIASLLIDNTHDPDRRVCTHAAEESCRSNDDCPTFLHCAEDGLCRERCDGLLLRCGEGRECELERGVCLEQASER